MYKKIIMETEFDAVPMTDISLEEYIGKDMGYIDIGGFEIKHPDFLHRIPFDFEATTFEVRDDDSYVFGNWDGLGCRIFDVDPCHEDEWKENGLEQKDITAKLLSEASEMTEYYFNLSDMNDQVVPVFLNVKDMRFCDENDVCYEIKKDVLADYNKLRVAEQVADFLNKKEGKPFDWNLLKEEVDVCVAILKSKQPEDLLNTIHILQKHGDDDKSREMVDFLTDCMMQVADSRDKIYRVGLIACGNIDHGENPYAQIEGVGGMYYYGNSIADCQEAVRSYIEGYGLGGSEFAGGLVYQGNTYAGAVSYNGRFWDKNDAHYNLAHLEKTELLAIDAYLQKHMPMFKRDVDGQRLLAQKKEKSLKVQLRNAADERNQQLNKTDSLEKDLKKDSHDRDSI